MEKSYERSLAGFVQRIQRPGNRWTAYQHDALGNIIRSDYYDGTWETFSYDKNGALQETENEHVTVKLERDPSGQVIKEWQNDHWIASSYDELGNRSHITSSLGAKIDVTRNELGNVLQMTASRSEQAQWTASMQYNELGQEIERILPGDVISKWQYDITGRPTHHRVSSQSRDTRRRAYNWDVNHQLRSMVNELTGVKVTYGQLGKISHRIVPNHLQKIVNLLRRLRVRVKYSQMSQQHGQQLDLKELNNLILYINGMILIGIIFVILVIKDLLVKQMPKQLKKDLHLN